MHKSFLESKQGSFQDNCMGIQKLKYRYLKNI